VLISAHSQSVLKVTTAKDYPRRIAFIAGVSEYENKGPKQLRDLPGVGEDLKMMRKALKDLDFEIYEAQPNPDLVELETGLRDFINEIRLAKGGCVALFYFSGHGAENGGVNYLIPSTADVSDAAFIKHEAFVAQRVIDAMLLANKSADAKESGVNLVFLDCCRNDLPNAVEGKNIIDDTGFAKMQTTGVFIGFATAPATIANAGERGSFYTRLLAEHMLFPGISINDMHSNLTGEVIDLAAKHNREQNPYFTNGIRGIFHLVPGPAAVTSPPPQTPPPISSTAIPISNPVSASSQRMEGNFAGEAKSIGGIEMVWCPPGDFITGKPGSAGGQHKVTLTTGFWLAKTETTQKQWEAVMKSNPSQFKGSNLPVDTVSWNDVQVWLAKMNNQNLVHPDWRWMLPTEAQSEYACRTGISTLPAVSLDATAWYDGNSDNQSHPVGTKAPNDWGLYDMQGNVLELCADQFSHDRFTSGLIDPFTKIDGTSPLRVYRGGSWRYDYKGCAVDYRGTVSSDKKHSFMGFRLALLPNQSAGTSDYLSTNGSKTTITGLPTQGMDGERYPETRLRTLTSEEISSWSFSKARYAINEMHARHGALFKIPEIQTVFQNKTWYKARKGMTADQIANQYFTALEKSNLKLIAAHRDRVAP